MLPLATLRAAVREALAYVSAQPDVAEAEVFAAANVNLTLRLNYTSHIPSNGVEEPKSVESHGLSIRAALRTPEGIRTGLGSEPGNLSPDGAARALDQARRGAVLDPEFVSLPTPAPAVPAPVPPPGAAPGLEPGAEPGRARYHDPALGRLSNARLLAQGWNMLEKGLDVFQSSEDLRAVARRQVQDEPKEGAAVSAGTGRELADLGLILGGDLVLLRERMAIASTHMPRVQTDESTLVLSFATAMVEERNAKGSGWSVSRRLADFTGESAGDAARRAIAAMDGHRVSSGSYRVILGPQPVAELLEWILLPGLQVDAFYADASPFMGRFGRQIASETLCLYDDGSRPGLAGSKSITDEGLPTGRSDLIQEGRLAGLLADYYNYRRILNDPRGREKLGVDPATVAPALAPRNGFRAGNGGGRDFSASPGIVPTNLIVAGREEWRREELLRLVGDGIYIGRIWYTYPVNGFTSGDFSGTIVGDSYLIKDGRLAGPVRPNTLRMNDNILKVINNLLGIGDERIGTVRWASDQVTWAPEVAVADFHLEEIGEYMDGVF